MTEPISWDEARDHLTAYCDDPRQLDYAIMIDGKWGSGKTYFMKEFLKDYKQNLYISLYGMSELRHIDDEIDSLLHPILTHKTTKFLGKVGKAFLKGTLKLDFDGDGKSEGSYSAPLPDLNIKDIQSDPQKYILVFDDLERCKIDLNGVLGYINSFVEHYGTKCVIIANESEIDNNDAAGYRRIKEKLVGRTIRVEPPTWTALKSFSSEIKSNKLKSIVNENIQSIVQIHKQSGTGNLRILKHSLWDFERLSICLSDEHWNKRDSIRQLMLVFLAVSFEYRSGRVNNAEDLYKLCNGSWARAIRRINKDEPSFDDIIRDRYSPLDLDDTVVSSEGLANFVASGVLDRARVERDLCDSSHFSSGGNAPLWLRAWRFRDLDDASAITVAAELLSGFEGCEIRVRFEAFHAFGILLDFSDLGLIGKSRKEISEIGKSFVDAMMSRGLFNIEYTPQNISDILYVYGGCQFFNFRDEDFLIFTRRFDKKLSEFCKKTYRKEAERIVNHLKSDPDQFFFEICLNDATDSKFYNVPIFSKLPVDVFLDVLFELDPSTQRKAFRALEERYSRGALLDTLKAEANWLSKLSSAIEARLSGFGPVTRERLEFLVDTKLKPLLEKGK